MGPCPSPLSFSSICRSCLLASHTLRSQPKCSVINLGFPLYFSGFPSALYKLSPQPSHLGTLIVSATLLFISYLLVSWLLLARFRHASIPPYCSGRSPTIFPPSYHLSFHPVYLAALICPGMPSGAPIS